MIHEYVTGRKITYMRPTSDGKHIICDPLDPRGWARDNVETGATAPRYTRTDHLLDAADKIIKDGKADTFIIQYLNRHGYRWAELNICGSIHGYTSNNLADAIRGAIIMLIIRENQPCSQQGG